MKPLNLKHNDKVVARVYASHYDSKSLDQLRSLSELDGFNFIHAFPDLHAGNDFPVGYVMKTKNMFYPKLTGADIGCNVHGVMIAEHLTNDDVYECAAFIKEKYTGTRNFPSLGNGNHFFEIGNDEQGQTWIVVHTGSRSKGGDAYRTLKQELDLTKSEGFNTQSMLFDRIYQIYEDAEESAVSNSTMILSSALNSLGIKSERNVITLHNTIDIRNEHVFHYKGASLVSNGEEALIPLSMGEGTMLIKSINTGAFFNGINHGAGRRMSRTAAKNSLNMSHLDGINYLSDSLPIDEAPAAYKDIHEDMNWFVENGYLEIITTIKPMITVKE